MASKGGGKVGGGGMYITAKEFAQMGLTKEFMTQQKITKQNQVLNDFFRSQGVFLDAAKANEHIMNPDFRLHYLTSPNRSAISNYTDYGYKFINYSLYRAYELKNPLVGNAKASVALLDTALAKLPAYKGVVNRGIKIVPEKLDAFLNAHKQGKTISFPAYTSTTTNGSGFTGNVKFKIHAKGKAGKTIFDLSKFSSEREVLFQRGAKFRVGKVNISSKTYSSGAVAKVAEIILYEK